MHLSWKTRVACLGWVPAVISATVGRNVPAQEPVAEPGQHWAVVIVGLPGDDGFALAFEAHAAVQRFDPHALLTALAQHRGQFARHFDFHLIPISVNRCFV